MLLRYVRAFIEKQKGKSAFSISKELIVRFLSIAAFPFLYLVLALISIYRPIRLGFLFHERLGHLALNTDLYLRRRHLGNIPANETHVFFVYSPANVQLCRMFARRMTLIHSEFLSKLISPFGLLRTRFWVPLPFFGNEYEEFNSAPPQIEFTEEEKRIGRDFLSRIGIDESQWYVCIFARDHRYYREFSPNTDVTFSDHRNADIDTYGLAIESIINAGGWVIRMGSSVEKPLSYKHPRVIDYASSCRDDFADVYITAHARFFVGTTSGASDMAVLFDVPFVGVNYMPIGCAPFGKHSIFIPKRIVLTVTGMQVPLKEQLLVFTGNQMSASIIPEHVLDEKGWQFRDNTPVEILEVVEEMMERLEGQFAEGPEYPEVLIRYSTMLPSENIYRSNKSPMGKKMLLSMYLGDSSPEQC